MDYLDFTRWLSGVVSPERASLIDDTFKALESLTDSQVYDIAINIGSQIERTDTVSLLDALNSDLITISDNVLIEYGIKLNKRHITPQNQYGLTKLLNGLVLLEGFECGQRLMQIIEATTNLNDTLTELLEEVLGESMIDITDWIDEIHPNLIERLIVLYRKKNEDNETVVEPSYAAKVRQVAKGLTGVVALFINNGGGLGLPFESYVRLFSTQIDYKQLKTLPTEFFGMLLASGHLTVDDASKAISERLDRFDFSLAAKMELTNQIKRLYQQYREGLKDA